VPGSKDAEQQKGLAMRNTNSTFYSLIKAVGYLALALMLVAIGYVTVLAVINWNGISV
tara:strand:+ start:631 stop:804 length:174 start_codon:yes stop_codon:yes gene_type:complete